MAKIKIADLQTKVVKIPKGSTTLMVAALGNYKVTYSTAPPTVITNGGTQRDRGFEFDYRRPKRAAEQ